MFNFNVLQHQLLTHLAYINRNLFNSRLYINHINSNNMLEQLNEIFLECMKYFLIVLCITGTCFKKLN